MPAPQADTEAWMRMVLRSMPPPAWLAADAPHSDVVLSSRVRMMRNLRGHRFPHLCEPAELTEVVQAVLAAVRAGKLGLEVHKTISNAEREYLVGCRLLSPDFKWNEVGRTLLLDQQRSFSLMVNEEDHLRLQALTAGWSIANAEAIAVRYESLLGDRLEFARSEEFGFLAASPFNAGTGKRLSCMLHLIGLAQSKRLPPVLKALAARGLTARGLFGESSRAVGAFVQVSMLQGDMSEFVGAVEYLLREERNARATMSRDSVALKAAEAAEFAVRSRSLSLGDTLRVLAWLRWSASISKGYAREIDSFLTTVEIQGDDSAGNVGRRRADALRALIGG